MTEGTCGDAQDTHTQTMPSARSRARHTDRQRVIRIGDCCRTFLHHKYGLPEGYDARGLQPSRPLSQHNCMRTAAILCAEFTKLVISHASNGDQVTERSHPKALSVHACCVAKPTLGGSRRRAKCRWRPATDMPMQVTPAR
jgi:hypothetical protein